MSSNPNSYVFGSKRAGKQPVKEDEVMLEAPLEPEVEHEAQDVMDTTEDVDVEEPNTHVFGRKFASKNRITEDMMDTTEDEATNTYIFGESGTYLYVSKSAPKQPVIDEDTMDTTEDAAVKTRTHVHKGNRYIFGSKRAGKQPVTKDEQPVTLTNLDGSEEVTPPSTPRSILKRRDSSPPQAHPEIANSPLANSPRALKDLNSPLRQQISQISGGYPRPRDLAAQYRSKTLSFVNSEYRFFSDHVIPEASRTTPIRIRFAETVAARTFSRRDAPIRASKDVDLAEREAARARRALPSSQPEPVRQLESFPSFTEQAGPSSETNPFRRRTESASQADSPPSQSSPSPSSSQRSAGPSLLSQLVAQSDPDHQLNCSCSECLLAHVSAIEQRLPDLHDSERLTAEASIQSARSAIRAASLYRRPHTEQHALTMTTRAERLVKDMCSWLDELNDMSDRLQRTNLEDSLY